MSRTRYRVGLVMFRLPLILTKVMAYAPQWLQGHSPLRLSVNLAADFVFLSGLFVLGGDFWDKLRALSVYVPGWSSGRPLTVCKSARLAVHLRPLWVKCELIKKTREGEGRGGNFPRPRLTKVLPSS